MVLFLVHPVGHVCRRQYHVIFDSQSVMFLLNKMTVHVTIVVVVVVVVDLLSLSWSIICLATPQAISDLYSQAACLFSDRV